MAKHSKSARDNRATQPTPNRAILAALWGKPIASCKFPNSSQSKPEILARQHRSLCHTLQGRRARGGLQ